MADERERVLVTGGDGGLGAWVVRELRLRGVTDVVVLDRESRPAVAFDDSRPTAPASAVVVGDVRDAALLRRVLRDEAITRVIHLAAIIGEACDDAPTEAIDIN